MALDALSLRAFTQALASNAPVPGGGGACALVGALGSALAGMVGNFTTGKKKYAEFEDDIGRILERVQTLQAELLSCVDEDAECFEPLSRAYGIPKDDPAREQTLEQALRLACKAPQKIMRCAAEAIMLHEELSVKGSTIMLSDVGVGVLCCKTALLGASINIYENTRLMSDRAFADSLRREAEALTLEYAERADKVYAQVMDKIR